MRYIRKLMRKILPSYGFYPLLVTVCTNFLVYGGAKIIAGNWKHYCLETALDRNIPFLPWTLAIYLGCYLFWIINYVIIARGEKAEVYRFFFADVMAKIVCFVFFLVLPTTNHRPVVPENGFWNHGMRYLYSIDSAENLFPSIHCLTSWFCFIGIRNRKEIPVWYRIFSAVAAAAVFLSTLTTKQHVLVDVAGGVLIAEGCFFLSGCWKLTPLYARLIKQKQKTEVLGKWKTEKKQQQT